MIGANYYCKTCLDILVHYCANVFDDAKIEGTQTCLCSFNMDKVLENEMDIDVFKIFIKNAIEFYRSTNSNSSLADVPMEEVQCKIKFDLLLSLAVIRINITKVIKGHYHTFLFFLPVRVGRYDESSHHLT